MAARSVSPDNTPRLQTHCRAARSAAVIKTSSVTSAAEEEEEVDEVYVLWVAKTAHVRCSSANSGAG